MGVGLLVYDRHLPIRMCWYCRGSGGPLRALFALEGRMGRGFHDEMGGPDSIASPSEWGRGVGVTAAGLPASPGVVREGESFTLPPIVPGEHRAGCDPTKKDWSGRVCLGCADASPSEKRVPSADELRHNTLLRRHLADPGYGAVRELSWREKCANGLGVASVPPRTHPSLSYRGAAWVIPPSESPWACPCDG